MGLIFSNYSPEKEALSLIKRADYFVFRSERFCTVFEKGFNKTSKFGPETGTPGPALYSLFIRNRQTPVTMRGGARLARAELALLSRFCAAGGATDSERFVLFGFHSYTMHRR
jgi:hypothetical protein